NRDVVREVVASDADDCRVPQAAALVNRDVRCPTANIDERDAKLFFVLRQDGLTRRELLDDCLRNSHAGTIYAGPDVLRRALISRNDVNVDLEASTGHADGSADSVLLVDDEILRQDVEDFAPSRERNRLCGVNRTPYVFTRDLPILSGDRNHAAAVEPLD